MTQIHTDFLRTVFTVTLNPGLDRKLVIPQLQENVVLRAVESRLDWGGKGFNVSRALQALGVPSTALGFVGGATGQLLERGLADLGIATDFVHIQGETRTNTVIAEAHSGRYIKVNEAGPTVTSAELARLRARLTGLATPGSYWVLAGSLPPGVPSTCYGELIAVLRERGARPVLDTSGEALRLGCAAGPFLVKPNQEEAAELLGRPLLTQADQLETVAYFLEQRVELVALSLGAEGLVLGSRNEVVQAVPPAVSVQTVVGVGDALLAGILWALVRGAPLRDVARWGVAAGTAAAREPGVGVGSRASVETIYRQVRVVTLR